jgi:hypothetical protein
MQIAEFRGFGPDAFARAVAIYMERAYPDGECPDVVRRRLELPESETLSGLLAAPQFELGINPTTKSPVYLLRLGNHRYPHMKLQIQPWPTSVGAMLSVNTHDQILGLDPSAPDAAEFRSLQRENQSLKEAIERAWDEQGLPTFLRYLRDYIALSP